MNPFPSLLRPVRPTLALVLAALCTFSAAARAEGSAASATGPRGGVEVSSSPATGEEATKAAPAPLAAKTGGVSVHVVEGARVLVDGADAGRADPAHPFELTLPPGDYSIRVVYDGGSNEKRKVLVTEGHVTTLDFRDLPGLRLLFEKRDRWLMGFTVGGGVFASDLEGSIGPQFEAGLVLNRALTKAVEFRTTIGLHGWVAEARGPNTFDQQGTYVGRDRIDTLGLAVSVEPGFVFHTR